MSHARGEYEDLKRIAPDVHDAVLALGRLASRAGLDKQLLELIELRASQINGCAFCLQFHVLQGERLGLAADKINLVAVWREAPIFSARERAALAWTESLTHLPDGVSDEVYAEARSQFSETELISTSLRPLPRSTLGTGSVLPIAGPLRPASPCERHPEAGTTAISGGERT
jgi:AhpD family alkylhydroperoxidase